VPVVTHQSNVLFTCLSKSIDRSRERFIVVDHQSNRTRVHPPMSCEQPAASEGGVTHNPWHGPFKHYTNVFVIDGANNRILLGMKRRGFGVGLWNGFGGKVEIGESVMDAAERELHEEANVKAEPKLRKVGEILYRFQDKASDPTMLVHIFTTSGIIGDPQESEEMTPQWHDIDAIPFDSMWTDDPIWFPLITGERDCTDANSAVGGDGDVGVEPESDEAAEVQQQVRDPKLVPSRECLGESHTPGFRLAFLFAADGKSFEQIELTE
jgi:8-oxo-dGTP pyrophosphatase MutT (NUDIX family)